MHSRRFVSALSKFLHFTFIVICIFINKCICVKKLKSKIKKKARMSVITSLIQHSSGSLSQCFTVTKRNKRHLNLKEIKISPTQKITQYSI